MADVAAETLDLAVADPPNAATAAIDLPDLAATGLGRPSLSLSLSL
jgi:hypothetical protein